MAFERNYKPDLKILLEVSVKHNGNVTAIARELNVNKVTLYRYFRRDPAGKSILAEVRSHSMSSDVELSEYVLRYALMNYKSDLKLAVRAAQTYLEGQGAQYGWFQPVTNPSSPEETRLEQEDEFIRLKVENTKLRVENTELKEKICIHADK